MLIYLEAANNHKPEQNDTTAKSLYE